MAQFTNFATLTYTGGSTNSNTVTGELLELTQLSKTALAETYTAGDMLVYVLSLRNTGSTAVTGLTLTDDLGGFLFGNNTVYPLAYVPGSLRYFVNGQVQTSPSVTAGPPLQIAGISIPAGGDVLIIYETTVTDFAPLAQGSVITTTATLTGPGITTPQTAQETVTVVSRPRLAIRKSLSPSTVTGSGPITYTFVIENSGNTPATAADDLVVSDTFNPALDNLVVTYNAESWTNGIQYSYNRATGLFTTTPGAITVPAATFTQNSDGTVTTVPGTSTLQIRGTI